MTTPTPNQRPALERIELPGGKSWLEKSETGHWWIRGHFEARLREFDDTSAKEFAATMQPQPALAPDAQKARSAEVEFTCGESQRNDDDRWWVAQWRGVGKACLETDMAWFPSEADARQCCDWLNRLALPVAQQGALREALELVLFEIDNFTQKSEPLQKLVYISNMSEKAIRAALSQPASPEPQLQNHFPSFGKPVEGMRLSPYVIDELTLCRNTWFLVDDNGVISAHEATAPEPQEGK